jgi:hypothetical protein
MRDSSLDDGLVCFHILSHPVTFRILVPGIFYIGHRVGRLASLNWHDQCYAFRSRRFSALFVGLISNFYGFWRSFLVITAFIMPTASNRFEIGHVFKYLGLESHSRFCNVDTTF